MSIRPLTNPIVAPVHPRLHADIHAAIETYPAGQFGTIVASMPGPLAIKYVPAKYAKGYVTGTIRQLRISTSAGFTWGTGTYVSPLLFPISTAIFGRVGIVARFDPTAWRVFDATKTTNQQLYIAWIGMQPLHGALTLTMHSQLANQYLRDLFRRSYRIDCVIFRPDQFNAIYTNLNDDVWMNVTDWTSAGEIASDTSVQLVDARFTVLLDEEFSPDRYDIERATLIGPIGPRQTNAQLMNDIATAYAARQHVAIEA